MGNTEELIMNFAVISGIKSYGHDIWVCHDEFLLDVYGQAPKMGF